MAFFGPYSDGNGSNQGYFQLSGGNVQQSSDGVNSVWEPVQGVSDAFLLPSGSDYYLYALHLNGTADRRRLGYWTEFEVVTDYAARKSDSNAILLDGSAGAPTPAPIGPVSTFETALSLSGHQIVDVAPGVAPSDVVVVSQLSALAQSLTSVINAGDTALQSDIDALELAIANLPAGLTMATVQAAIEASVAEAVLNEVIDDAQKQALVDAVLAQLSTIDTAVIGRVGVAEALLAALEPRVAAVEAKNATQDAAIADGIAKDAAQDAAIVAATVAAQSAIAVNASQDARLANIEVAAAAVNQAITPVEVNILTGVITSAVGVAFGDVSIDNSNATHMTVSINLGASNAGKRRVDQGFRVMPNGTEVDLGHAPSRNGEVYMFTFLKERAGSTAVTLLLN